MRTNNCIDNKLFELDKPSISVFFTFQKNLDGDSAYQKFGVQLPEQLKKHVARFRYQQQRDQRILCFSLIRYGFLKSGYQVDPLPLIQYNRNGMPCFANTFYPGISASYSGDIVIIALFNGCRGAVDIEQIKEVALDNFMDFFPGAIWKVINSSASPTEKFFEYWTRIECVLKAEGCGLSMEIDQLSFGNGDIQVGGASWNTQKLDVFPSHICHLSHNTANENVNVYRVSSEALKEAVFCNNYDGKD